MSASSLDPIQHELKVASGDTQPVRQPLDLRGTPQNLALEDAVTEAQRRAITAGVQIIVDACGRTLGAQVEAAPVGAVEQLTR